MANDNVSSPADTLALSAVLSDVYDAALDPERWPRALGSVCEFVGGSVGQIFWQDASAAPAIRLHSHNDDPHYTKLYLETYAMLCPVFPAATFQSIGQVNTASDHVPDPDMHETRFYKEWMAPQDVTDALGVVLEKDGTRAAFLAVQWKHDPIGEEARQRMRLLVPHLLRAAAIGRLFLDRADEIRALGDTLNHLDAGTVLVSEDGHVVFANEAARRLAGQGRWIREEEGRLRAVQAGADRALARTLRAIAAGDGPSGGEPPVIPLGAGDEGGCGATVLPLTDGARRRSGSSPRAIAAIFVRPQTPPPVSPIETLAERYELTASELRVADANLRLSGLDTIAEALGISRATVKTHLNRVYRKCGVRNQAELIRLVAGLGDDV